jgi:hypothetical protein
MFIIYMRLLRLTTESQECIFESEFNSNLIIKPYSQIALSSFTTQLDNLNLTIDSQNNDISFSVDGNNNYKTLTLPNGVYTSATVDDFWRTTTQLFNQSMLFNAKEINRQWFCGIKSGRAVFQNLYGSVVAPLSVTSQGLYKTQGLITGGTGAGKMKRATVGNGNDSYLYIISPVNKGAGCLRAGLFSDFTPSTDSGFILGYTAENPPASTNPLPYDPNNIIYGIKYNGLGANYFLIKNGVQTDTSIISIIGDTLEIQTVGGVVNFVIYRDNPFSEITLGTSSYNHIDNIFPIAMFTGSNTVFYNIQFTSDEFYNKKNYPTASDLEVLNADIVKITKNGVATNCYLQFNNPDLATLLGFKNSRYPSSGFESSINLEFLADQAFSLRDFSESYIVELLNIKLDSMDTISKGPRSFLYSIPQLSAIKEHVVYQVPQLIFLDINNTFEINLREVKARILKQNLSKITCYGLSELVLIIKDKDE